MTRAPDRQVAVAYVIARLNVGGATTQVLSLASKLRPNYRTKVITGVEGPREGHMQPLARALDVQAEVIPSLTRELGLHDLRAQLAVVKILRRDRPMILHTHTAKAGTIGRTAALLMGPRRPPVIVHTFHGHVLEGYFSRARSAFFRAVERMLARVSTRLVVVSDEVKGDLVSLKIAPPEQIEVVPLGLDLDRLVVDDDERARLRAALRSELDIPSERKLVTFVGRLVPIKRLDRFLSVAHRLAQQRHDVHFLIVGDGELRPELEASEAAQALGDRLTWAGFRQDLPAIYSASDVVALTSDNEGTPVSLIEAQAAGVPVVATDVGGTSDVVEDGTTGRLLDRDDEEGVAAAIDAVLSDEALTRRLVDAGRSSAVSRYSLERMIRDTDELYTRLLAEAGVKTTT